MSSRYELVSSKYEKGNFINEKVIYTSSIIDIDRLTCRYNSAHSLILNCNDNSHLDNNSVSIRGKVRGSSNYFYIPALFNHEELLPLINTAYSKKVFVGGRSIPVDFINTSDEVFKKNKDEFYQLLRGNRDVFFNDILTGNLKKELRRFASNYLSNLDSINLYAREDSIHNFNNTKKLLDDELSKYHVFRSYLVSLDNYNKYKDRCFQLNTCYGNVKVTPNLNSSVSYNVKKEVSSSYVSYDDSNEKEEFLSDDEIIASVGEENDLKGYVRYGRK